MDVAAVAAYGRASRGQVLITDGRGGTIPALGVEVYNPKAYGAKLDGIADDTAPIQETLDAAIETGGTVTIPDTVALITNTLRIDNARGVSLVGGGRSWEAGSHASFLKWGGDPGKPMIRLRNVLMCSVRGLGLDGRSVAGTTGILLDSDGTTVSAHNWFDDLSIVNVSAGFQNGTRREVTYESDLWSLDHCFISGSGDDAVGLVLNNGGSGFGCVSNTSFMNCAKGIQMLFAGPMLYRNVNGYGPAAGSVFVSIEGQYWCFAMEQCQWETVGAGHFFLSTSDDNYSPIRLNGCPISQPWRWTSTNGATAVLSQGCVISGEIRLGANTYWTSISDRFNHPGIPPGSLVKGEAGRLDIIGNVP